RLFQRIGAGFDLLGRRLVLLTCFVGHIASLVQTATRKRSSLPLSCRYVNLTRITQPAGLSNPCNHNYRAQGPRVSSRRQAAFEGLCGRQGSATASLRKLQARDRDSRAKQLRGEPLNLERAPLCMQRVQNSTTWWNESRKRKFLSL